jgi:hypothetical protein
MMMATDDDDESMCFFFSLSLRCVVFVVIIIYLKEAFWERSGEARAMRLGGFLFPSIVSVNDCRPGGRKEK